MWLLPSPSPSPWAGRGIWKVDTETETKKSQTPRMPRTILMGDPTHFSVLGGANPHTRDALGRKKTVDADLARRQWHNLARALVAHGVEICVIEPHRRLTGLVYPANAGFLYPPTALTADVHKVFYLANLLPT